MPFLLSHLLLLLPSFVAVSADILPFLDSKDYQRGRWGNYPAQTYLSDQNVIGPVPNVLVEAQEGVSPNEYITWAPTGWNIPLTGPQLLDAKTLSVVYQAPLFGPDNFGLSVQTCNDTDYLVWWSGVNINGRAAGQFHILSTNYEDLWNITAVGLEYADAHDLFLTPECTAVFTVNEPREYDMTDFNIGNGWIQESYFQEVDIATGELLFQWRASDHVDLHDSFWVPSIRGPDFGWQGGKMDDAWDFFHINSVEKDFRGNYLISARHYAALYYIDGQSGNIHWTLGGKRNDFKDLSDGQATNFAWQHHARWANAELTSISLFDDRNCRYLKSEDGVSRGIIFDLDYMTRTVKATSYKATTSIESFRKGGTQHLENDNVILGYGNEPGFTEYAPNGTVLYDVRFGPMGLDRDTADNYRVLKLNWTGNPAWNPRISAGPFLQDSYKFVGSGAHEALPMLPNNTAYFSWNGGTRLAKWAILASNNSTRLENVSQLWCELPKTGFETSLHVGDAARYVRAIAVSRDDDVLAASPVLDMHTGETSEQPWSPLDFNADWREDQEEDDREEDLSAQYDSLKQDWQSMKATTQNIFIAIIVGGLFATFIVIAALTWHCRAAFVGLFKRRDKEGYTDIGDEEEVSVSSLDIPRLDLLWKSDESVNGTREEKDMSPLVENTLYDSEGRGLLGANGV